MLARDLGCKSLEFIPIRYDKIRQALDSGVIDIAMGCVSKTVDRITELDYTISYMTITLALVAHDYEIDKFRSTEELRKMRNLKLAVLKGSAYKTAVEKVRPDIKFIEIDNVEEYYTGKIKADALLTSAEQGAAFCMVYPKFDVVVPKPEIFRNELAYAIARNDLEFSKYLNEWLAIKKGQGVIDKLADYWIYGKNINYKQPRWNLWDDVLRDWIFY